MPIVMPSIAVDPVKAGFVVSLARPGGNITGLTKLDSELHGKRLELLKEAFPRISRVVILWPRRHQKHAMKEVKAAGQSLGIQIQPLLVTRRSTLDDLESAFSTISQDSPDALLVAASFFVNANQARVIEFTAKRRLPRIYHWSRFVDAGGLMSYSAADLFCLASSREGWPNVLLESLACGTPEVATSVGGIPEIICSDRIGLLTKQSEREVAEGVSLALKKSWLSDSIVQYAREHTWDRLARSVFHVFESVLDGVGI